MDVVAYLGNDRVGKSTMARALQTIMHQGCRKRTAVLSFSDGLRQELVSCYGLPVTMVYNRSLDKKNVMIPLSSYTINEDIIPLWIDIGRVSDEKAFFDTTVSLRELMYIHGTCIRRRQDKYYWTHILDRRIQRLENEIDLIVIDDPRDPDDFEYILSKSGKLIHLYNNCTGDDNPAQREMNDWVEQNKEKITMGIEVPMPLLNYTAERLIINHVFYELIPKGRKRTVYCQWVEDDA